MVVFFAGIASAAVSVLGLYLSIRQSREIPKEFLSSLLKIIDARSIALVFSPLIPLCILFAAILLSISIFAHSFKEAQSIMTPLNFVVIFPVFVGLFSRNRFKRHHRTDSGAQRLSGHPGNHFRDHPFAFPNAGVWLALCCGGPGTLFPCEVISAGKCHFPGKLSAETGSRRSTLDLMDAFPYNISEFMNIKKSNHPEDSRYRQLVHKHFPYIEKQCHHAVNLRRRSISSKNHIDIENEVLELSNRVLDQLSKNDFQVLKRFQNQARFTTYLSTIIANQAVDLIRKRRGRDRTGDRARRYGELGHHIYQKIIIEGLTVEKAYQEICTGPTLTQTREEFDQIVEKIRGSGNNPVRFLHLDDGSIKPETISGLESASAVANGNSNNPETITIEKTGQRKAAEILNRIIRELRGEERLILRMRYPAGDDEPLAVETIAQKLGISQKAVYKRLHRIFNKCRKMINEMGVDIHDLL